MKFDIVFVTYNSKKWLKKNIESIIDSDYDLKNNVSLYYYDNKSTDDTVEELYNLKKKYGDKFNNFVVIEGNANKGFGYGNNQAAKAGNSEYVFFLNTDTEIKKDTLKELEKKINESKDEFSIFELKQEPYEHPKYYNPLNGEVSWASGACVIFDRKVFEKCGGFDKNLFMYCEDVEISWHARQMGYKIKYLYDLGIIHYSYTEPGEFKTTAFIYMYINNLYLRCKYGSLKNALKGLLLTGKAMYRNKAKPTLTDEQYKPVAKKMRKAFWSMFFKYLGARIYKHTHMRKGSFEPRFINLLDYEAVKVNSFREPNNEPIKGNPLVSIIVRTCNRPDTLRETLISLRNQSYKNIEVVVVEDGKDTTSKMINEEFSDLNIIYKAAGKHVGRSAVGNMGVELSHGKYINFLDDDDLFFYDHVEVLVREAVKNKYEIVYDTAFETQYNVISRVPYKYYVKYVDVIHKEQFDRLALYSHNLFPIQTIMFERKVYDECGGFDESMDALEDWELWIRFSLKYDFHYVNDTTSLYRVPLHQDVSKERQEFIDSYLDYVLEKHANSKFEMTVSNAFKTVNRR